jgi:hypothetical protein
MVMCVGGYNDDDNATRYVFQTSDRLALVCTACMYVCMYAYVYPSIHLCVCVCARGEPVRVHGDGQHACMQAAPCAVGWGHVPLSDVVCLAQVSERERRTHTHTQVRDRET